MNNSSAINLKTDNMPVETEGARRATGVSTGSAIQSSRFPDPEVTEKSVRRKFTAKYKLRILQEAEACTSQGQMGALLRREGLYSSNLTTWRRQRKQGDLEALSPKHRGPKAKSSILPLVVLLNWKVKTTILNKNSNRQKPLLTSKKTLGNTSEATGPTGEKI